MSTKKKKDELAKTNPAPAGLESTGKVLVDLVLEGLAAELPTLGLNPDDVSSVDAMQEVAAALPSLMDLVARECKSAGQRVARELKASLLARSARG